MTNTETLKRLYQSYTKRYLKKIILAVFLSACIAGSTSAIAYLLDPAIRKIFIEHDSTLMVIIPIFIVIFEKS